MAFYMAWEWMVKATPVLGDQNHVKPSCRQGIILNIFNIRKLTPCNSTFITEVLQKR